MPRTVKVFSDYVCPYCFLAEGPLEEAVRAAGHEVAVEWMPFELRPYPNPTLRPEGAYLQRAWAQSVYPLAAELGVPIKLPRVSPQPYTRLAFEGYQFAREAGLGAAYTHRAFAAFFQAEKDIGRIEVLADLAGELGLDREAFVRALEEGRYRDAHAAALLRAHEMGISAVPTFVIGEHVLTGLQPAEALKRAIESAGD